MRVLGVDPSSSYVAAALIVSGHVKWVHVWSPPREGMSDKARLWDCYLWMRRQIKLAQPDMLGVEIMRHARNIDTVRVVSYFGATALLAAAASRVPVVKQIHVGQARKHAVGNGNMPKEDVFKVVKKMFPHIKFRRFDAGGSDQADAIVIGIATPSVSEEQSK